MGARALMGDLNDLGERGEGDLCGRLATQIETDGRMHAGIMQRIEAFGLHALKREGHLLHGADHPDIGHAGLKRRFILLILRT